MNLANAEKLWWQEYVPLLHVVSVTGLPMTAAADKLAQEDLSTSASCSWPACSAPSCCSPPNPT